MIIRTRARTSVSFFFATAICTARVAIAQEPSVPPQALWFAPVPSIASMSPPSMSLPSLLGEPTGDNGGLPSYLASSPLRLSLQSGIFPMAGGFANCATREEASGNSVGGIPIQRYTMLRLTPNLVLNGFSSAGCPIDGAVGGGFTYTVPVKSSLWLVFGAGAYGVPAFAPLPARVSSDIRVDLIEKTRDGHTLSVGVGKRGLTFGGGF